MIPDLADRRPALWTSVEEEPLEAHLPALLDRAVERHPERLFWVSIDGDTTRLTYAEFSRQSNACARGLRALGVKRGMNVGLVMPNAAAFMLCWFALCRLGATAVMINTGSTSTELGRMLATTDAHFLLVDHEYLHTYEGLPNASRLPAAQVILHGSPRAAEFAPEYVAWTDLLSGPCDDLPLPDVSPEDVASIQFTSGSMGVPKACMLSHRYWLILGKARMCVGAGAATPERMLIDSPMFYMGPMWRVVMAIYVGATLYVAPRFSLSRLFDRILHNKIDFCSVTYPVAKLEDDPRIAHSSLKYVTTYGLSKELHVGLEKRLGVPVREIYGMTEVGSVLSMPVHDTSMVGSGSCGRPAPFRRCVVVANGEEVPVGRAGELWVSGPGMFSGYYGNPEATAASFAGEWFKTGDLFCRDERGYYFMLGRIKDVIRRSGENISAVEVELTVNAIEGVLESAAIPVADPLRGEEVKVVVVRAPGDRGARLAPQEIVRACQQSLAPFKVPRYVEFIDMLPKTPNGKIDKNFLKATVTVPGADTHDARPEKKRST